MKKALIIGGTPGIGYGPAEELIDNHYSVSNSGDEKSRIKELQGFWKKSLV